MIDINDFVGNIFEEEEDIWNHVKEGSIDWCDSEPEKGFKRFPTNYDPKLRERLPATNNAKTGIVLNASFRSTEEQINGYLDGRYLRQVMDDENLEMESAYQLIKGYDYGPLREFYTECVEHAAVYSQGTDTDNLIVLTHPFFLHMTHMHEIGSAHIMQEAEEYLDRLMGLLSLGLPRDKVSVVAFETPHHYAAATSLLLEEGFIDDVVFTRFDCGYLIDPSDIAHLGKKRFYVGGGYNERCLSSSLEEIKKVAGKANIGAVSELCLDSPQDRTDSLRPKYVWIDDRDGIAPEISLDEMVETFS